MLTLYTRTVIKLYYSFRIIKLFRIIPVRGICLLILCANVRLYKQTNYNLKYEIVNIIGLRKLMNIHWGNLESWYARH